MTELEAMRQELEGFWRSKDAWYDARWYTPEEWAARGEAYGDKAVLHLTFEGPLYHAFNAGWEERPPFGIQTRSQEIAEAHGYWWELGFAWSMHFYKRERRPLLTSANGFALDLQQLTRMTRLLARDARAGDLAPVVPPDEPDHASLLEHLRDAQDALDCAFEILEARGHYKAASYRMALYDYKPSFEARALEAKQKRVETLLKAKKRKPGSPERSLPAKTPAKTPAAKAAS